MGVALLYSAYCLQDLYLPANSFFAKIMIFTLLVIGLYSLILTKWKESTTVVKFWKLFFLVNLIYYIISPKEVVGVKYEAIGRISTMIQFKDICIFLLTFFSMYRYSCRNLVTHRMIANLGLLFFVVSVLKFFIMKDAKAEETGFEDNTNNAAYLLVMIIPYLPFIWKEFKPLFMIIVPSIIFLVIMGAKRGAILCMFFSVFIGLFFYLRSYKVKPVHIAFLGFLIVLLAFIVFLSYDSSEYLQARMNRMDSGNDASGDIRKFAYALLFNHWLNNSSFFEMIFGNGTTQTVTIWGNFAHNDWLELLIDNGILGVVIYAILLYSLFKYSRKCTNIISGLSIRLVWAIWFPMTLFSMGYTSYEGYAMTFLLGILFGNETKFKILQKEQIRL